VLVLFFETWDFDVPTFSAHWWLKPALIAYPVKTEFGSINKKRRAWW